MAQYTVELPSISIDPQIPEFFQNFYKLSDSPTDHEAYTKSFTDKAVMIMGTKQVEGSANILELRKGLWNGPVSTRKHRVFKIFPFGDDSNEVMLYGDVKYGLKNGKSVSVDWSARAVFSGSGKTLKMHFYQVYLDSAPLTVAAKDD